MRWCGGEVVVDWDWTVVAEVGAGMPGEYDVESREPSRFRARGAGGAMYDVRLFFSIICIAHSCMSTGVLFAACRNRSLSCGTD